MIFRIVFISYLQGFIFLTRNYCDNWIWQHYDEIASRMQCHAGQTQANNGQHIHVFRKTRKIVLWFRLCFFFILVFFLVFAMFILKCHTFGAMGRCFPMFGCSTSAVASTLMPRQVWVLEHAPDVISSAFHGGLAMVPHCQTKPCDQSTRNSGSRPKVGDT